MLAIQILVSLGVLGLAGWLLYPMTKLRPDANSAEKMRIGFVMGMMNGGKDPVSAGQAAGAAAALIERFEQIHGRKPTPKDKALIMGMVAGMSGTATGVGDGSGVRL